MFFVGLYQSSQSSRKNVCHVASEKRQSEKSLLCPLVDKHQKCLYTSVITQLCTHENETMCVSSSVQSHHHQLVRQGGDPHALTGDGVGHHRGGGVTHGDARQRLRHGDCYRCHRHSHWCHGNRRGHTDGLREGGRERRDLWVEVRRRSGGRGGVGRGRRRGTGGGDQVLLRDGPRLQPGAAQGGVGLSDAVVVGAHCSHRRRQALLGGRRGGGERHHLGLAAELGVLLQENFVCGDEI